MKVCVGVAFGVGKSVMLLGLLAIWAFGRAAGKAIWADMGHMLGDPMKWTQTLSAILKNAV